MVLCYVIEFYFILVQLTIHNTYGVILRESCLQYADFSYQKQNAALQGSVIATFTNKSPKECEAECINEYFCKSINTEFAGDKKCELNSATEADKVDSVTVTSRTGWTFMSTRYNESLVGEYCKAYNPCPSGQLCVDSCQCPGFTCITCKTMHFGINCLSTRLAIDNSAVGVEDSSTITDEQMTSSSDENGDNRAWKARLNQNSVWCAKNHDQNQFIQVIFKRRMIISGIAVQGKKSSNKMVQKYMLEYSVDKVTRKMYTENGIVKVFDGPKSQDEVKKSVLGYYLQAYIIVLRPTKWYSKICMRIEVYGVVDFWWPKDQEPTALGLESGIVQNNQFTASSSKTVIGWGGSTTYHPYDARLNGPSRWCPDGLMDQHPWIKVTFQTRKIITHITVQRGFPDAGSYVKEYKVSYSEDKWQSREENTAWNIWQEYKENSTVRVFIGPSSSVASRRQMLSYPIRAFAIKISPTDGHSNKCLRMEFYGYDDPVQPSNPTGCSALAEPLGLETKTITDDKMTASSEFDVYHAAALGRLNNDMPWCSKAIVPPQYLQVDLGKIMIVAGIASQGHSGYEVFVRTYKIQYAETDLAFKFYPSDASPKIFNANYNSAQIVKNRIDPPIRAQHIRIVCVTNLGADHCMRIEIYGCEPQGLSP